jgi:hypothetical protein
MDACTLRLTSWPGYCRWAQQLAGLDFISALPDDRQSLLEGLKGYRQQQRAEVFVSKALSILRGAP